MMFNRDISIPKKPKRIQPTKRTKASRVTDFQVHVRSTLPTVEATETCNAPTYKGLCRLDSGQGTPHSIGKCSTHSKGHEPTQAVTASAEARGLYSQGVPTNLKLRYNMMLESPDLLSVNNEMAMLKAMLFQMAEGIGDISSLWEDEDGRKQINDFISNFEKVTRLSFKAAEIQSKSEFVITVPQLMKVIQQIAVIIKESCLDCPIEGRVIQVQTRIATEVDVTGKHVNDNVIEAEYDLEG